MEPVDKLELMGLTSSTEQPPYSQEYGEIYEAFEALADICPIPEANDMGDQLGIWKFDDPAHDRTIQYTVSQSSYSRERKPDQKIVVMDRKNKTMYEIHNEEHTLGAGKRSFQVRAFTHIRDVNMLDEYDNYTDEVGINYSNDQALDRTQYFCPWGDGADGNYAATLNAHGNLTQGQLYSWLPYKEGKTAAINSDGFVVVTRPGGETISTELVRHEVIMQFLSEFLQTMRQPTPPYAFAASAEVNQKFKTQYSEEGKNFVRRVKAAILKIFR